MCKSNCFLKSIQHYLYTSITKHGEIVFAFLLFRRHSPYAKPVFSVHMVRQVIRTGNIITEYTGQIEESLSGVTRAVTLVKPLNSKLKINYLRYYMNTKGNPDKTHKLLYHYTFQHPKKEPCLNNSQIFGKNNIFTNKSIFSNACHPDLFNFLLDYSILKKPVLYLLRFQSRQCFY